MNAMTNEQASAAPMTSTAPERTFTCGHCHAPAPWSKRIPVAAGRHWCPTCLLEHHLQLYREVDEIAAGAAGKRRKVTYGPAVEDVVGILAHEVGAGATLDEAKAVAALAIPPRGKKRAAASAKAPAAPTKRGAAADPGAVKVLHRLVRTYKGAAVTVNVHEGGWFGWAGKMYPNATSAAEAIVGYHISGPAFFSKAEKVAA